MSERRARIGVLALQGDFQEHARALRGLGAEPVEVRLPAQLSGLDGLIIPGGESTTIGKLLVGYGFIDPLRGRIQAGFPVYGTCAGAILLAERIENQPEPWLGVMDIGVRRNAFGRQIASFEMDLAIGALGNPPFQAIFIRAPQIIETGRRVQTLACLDNRTVVAARQDNLLVTSFHPELTNDARLHGYFLKMVEDVR